MKVHVLLGAEGDMGTASGAVVVGGACQACSPQRLERVEFAFIPTAGRDGSATATARPR